MPKVPEKVMTGGMVCAGRAMPEGFWHAPDSSAVLYLGNCVDQLKRLPARSVHMCCTSPPYWNLRDYGTAEWDGGDESCDHIAPFQPRSERPNVSGSGIGKGGAYDLQIGAEPLPDCGTHGQAQCGDCFVCNMVKVFREVRRVLRDDGTCWLNLGDSYAGNSSGYRPGEGKVEGFGANRNGVPACGIPAGNLIGVPWRVALALQADGWVLRQEIIWAKPNPMPESVENRCSKSHEHIFLLAKQETYYFDNIAIRTGQDDPPRIRRAGHKVERMTDEISGLQRTKGGFAKNDTITVGANKRDVWVVPTRGYAGAHFAVYSPQLITPCILAGTSEHGCCAKCGAPYERVVDKSGGTKAKPVEDGRIGDMVYSRNGCTGTLDGTPATRTTAGWRPTCHCNAGVESCVVLDPFVGSGTTVATAIQYGRRGVGIDLSEKYLLENAIPRIEAAINGEKVKKKEVPVLVDRSPPPKVKVLRVGTNNRS